MGKFSTHFDSANANYLNALYNSSNYSVRQLDFFPNGNIIPPQCKSDLNILLMPDSDFDCATVNFGPY